MSIQRQLFQNLRTKLLELSWANYVEYEEIKLLVSDFDAHEMPAIQIYDNGEAATDLQSRNEIVLSFSIELVMTRNVGETINQGLLFDRKLEIKRKVGEDPKVGVLSNSSEGSFQHIRYVGSQTDFHSIKPHYLARLDFEALFIEPFTRDC